MAAPDQSTFEKIVASFQTRLSRQDLELFRITTLADLKDAINTIQKEQVGKHRFRNLTRIKPFLDGLAAYSSIIEQFVQVKPEILAFIWVSW